MIYVSYRRSDTQFPATFLASRLKAVYGDDTVFIDFTDHPLGSAWPDQLDARLNAARVVLVLVGKDWNTPRLRNPDDWVRIEVCTALRAGKTILVVRLDDVPLPRKDDLPDDCELPQLHDLLNIPLRALGDYEADFTHLCRALDNELHNVRDPNRTSPQSSPLQNPPDHPNTAHHPAGEWPETEPSHPPSTAESFAFLSPTDRPGELGRLGPYWVVKLLGKGGMGYVFRAKDDNLKRVIALKVMKPEEAVKPTALKRFIREGRAMAAVKSDHVVTIHHVGEANGTAYLAMEFLEGENLDDWLKANPSLASPEIVVRVAKEVLTGLVATHEKGLIHRDIKPANLWRDAHTGRIKLLDFGITRLEFAETELTRTGELLGTPAWMAPEQAEDLPVDARTDLFSFGVVLYRMIAGSNPFQKPSVAACVRALMNHNPPPASSFNLVPEDLASLIDQMMAKAPDDRPATAKTALTVVLEVEQQLIANRAKRRETVSAISALFASPWAETVEEFDYVIEGEHHKGTRQVRTFNIGGGVQMEFVRVPKGTFWMGAPNGEEDSNEDEKPHRPVEISRDFYLGKFQVTQAQYRAVTGKSPSYFRGERLPVEQVSWLEAVRFCEMVSDLTKWAFDCPLKRSGSTPVARRQPLLSTSGLS